MLKISDVAIKEFKSIIEELDAPEAGIRVYVKSGSCCQGPGIGLDLIKKPVGKHKTIDYDGLKVFVEEQDMEMLSDAMIDYFPHSDNPGFSVKWAKKPASGSCGCN